MARRGSLRIVAGGLGGRRLAAPPPGTEARPSTERVREAVFSILGRIEGAALDLFCGSGAYGIEAISRGAGSAVLVDLRPEVAHANVETLGLGGRIEVVRAEAVRWVGKRDPDRGRFDLAFCDPPYRLARSIGPQLDDVLPAHLQPGARVICESAVAAPLELGARFELARERAYGGTLVRIYEVRR